MDVRAGARFIRVPPRKARAVAALVKGKHVHDALAILKFTPNASARIMEKILKSAIANAENNNRLDGDALKVQQVVVDQGPSMKRVQPRAMGRAYRILKRTSHIFFVLTEAEARPARGHKAEGKTRRGFLSRARKDATEPAKQVEDTSETKRGRRKKEPTGPLPHEELEAHIAPAVASEAVQGGPPEIEPPEENKFEEKAEGGD